MAAQSNTRSCPYCKEEIRADARRCKYCRSGVSPETPEHGGTCPFCKEEVNPEATKCRHCGSVIATSGDDCEGCGDPAVTAMMAPGRGGLGGGFIDIDPDCAARLLRCNLECVYKHPNDPMMQQACRDSCRASYRLCRSFSSGGLSIY